MRFPTLAEFKQLFGAWQLLPSVSQREAFSNTVIGHWQDVWPAEGKDQEHFDRPGADASHAGQLLKDLLVAHALNGSRSGHHAGEGFGRDIFESGTLGSRQASAAQF